MKIIKNPGEFNLILSRLRKKGKRIGFVPTMGALHEGHLSLVRAAGKENDVVVVSIFVNPTQFGPKEDLSRYPRNFKKDVRTLKSEKVDFLFFPSEVSIYPKNFKNFIEPGPVARYLCGPKRPGHFRGVATVVNRLFEIVEPDVAYFGQKDYQQARVIQEMVKRLQLKIRIKVLATLREKDGLAMSSRNQYLSKRERILAPLVYHSLLLAKRMIWKGERDPQKIQKLMRDYLKSGMAKIDYVEIVNPKTCAPVEVIRLPVVVAVACYLGATRLIDNLVIKS